MAGKQKPNLGDLQVDLTAALETFFLNSANYYYYTQ